MQKYLVYSKHHIFCTTEGTLDRFEQTVQKQYLNLFWGSYATLKSETKRNI